MPINFRSSITIIITALFCSACVYEVDYPDYEVYNSLNALATPGEKLDLVVGKTSTTNPNFTFDSIHTTLDNGDLIDTFSTISKLSIAWGTTYKLECRPANESTLSIQFSVPDSFGIELIEVDSLSNPFYLNDRIFRYRFDLKLTEVDPNTPYNLYLGRPLSNAVLSIDSTQITRIESLQGPATLDTLSVWSASPNFELSFLGNDLYQLLKDDAINLLQSGQIGPVTHSNVDGGVGVVDFYYVLSISR